LRAVLLISLIVLLGGCRVSMNDMFGFQNVRPPEQLLVADEFVGMNERADRVTLKEFLGVDPVHVEWCAAFVNSVLHEVGIDSTSSLMARSYLSWGTSTDTPAPGDIMVFSRGDSSWQGHVGFYVATVEYRDRKYWIVLGGNQDNSVSYRLYPENHWRHLDTRTVNLNPTALEVLRAQQWMLSGIPLEMIAP
jgi:uncharacterized protein (TIGR02594 family)